MKYLNIKSPFIKGLIKKTNWDNRQYIDDLIDLHRYMHENKFIYKTIHKIHHRANTPMPIEYIYVHPLEWSSGMIGPFLGMIAIGGISFESYMLYLIIRNMHEKYLEAGADVITTNTFAYM